MHLLERASTEQTRVRLDNSRWRQVGGIKIHRSVLLVFLMFLYREEAEFAGIPCN